MNCTLSTLIISSGGKEIARNFITHLHLMVKNSCLLGRNFVFNLVSEVSSSLQLIIANFWINFQDTSVGASLYSLSTNRSRIVEFKITNSVSICEIVDHLLFIGICEQNSATPLYLGFNVALRSYFFLGLPSNPSKLASSSLNDLVITGAILLVFEHNLCKFNHNIFSNTLKRFLKHYFGSKNSCTS